jgi:hypothetical protein
VLGQRTLYNFTQYMPLWVKGLVAFEVRVSKVWIYRDIRPIFENARTFIAQNHRVPDLVQSYSAKGENIMEVQANCLHLDPHPPFFRF